MGEPSPYRNICITNCCPPVMRKRDVWRIDQFSLSKKIGSGYASTVYLGSCRFSGNSVAIKMYHKNKLSELNYFQVNREINIHSGLNHKNIIQLWASFEDQYGIFLVTEFAGGGDVFADVGRRGGQLNESDTVRQIIHPFLRSLIYLHDRKIIHRDIKPENLLLTSAGVLKVADFGLSINYDVEHPVTRVGTLDYMAPEVVVCPDKQKPRDHKENTKLHYSPLVDAWAVGVLTYELIVGRPPFDKGQKRATIEQILKGEPAMPSKMSESGVHFIKWALTKDHRKRPNVMELIEHPWVSSNMMPQLHLGHLRGGATQGLGRSDSYVAPLIDHSNDSSSPNNVIQQLQAESVQQSGHLLNHSLSMSAVDSMRWRDIALEQATGEAGEDKWGEFDLPLSLMRKSDSTAEDLPGSRRNSQASLVNMLNNLELLRTSPGVLESKGSGSFTRCSPRCSPGSSPVTPRMREEVMAALRQPISPRTGSFSAGRSKGSFSAMKSGGGSGSGSGSGSFTAGKSGSKLSVSSSVNHPCQLSFSSSITPRNQSPPSQTSADLSAAASLSRYLAKSSSLKALAPDSNGLRPHISHSPTSPSSLSMHPQPPIHPRNSQDQMLRPIQQPLHQSGLSRLGSFTQNSSPMVAGRMLKPAPLDTIEIGSHCSPVCASPVLSACRSSPYESPRSRDYSVPTSPFARTDMRPRPPKEDHPVHAENLEEGAPTGAAPSLLTVPNLMKALRG